MLLIFVVHARFSSHQPRELLAFRSAELSDDLGLAQPHWSSFRKQNLANNIGAANLKIHDTIREINSIQHEPEFAAAIHMLETSTKQSSNAMDELKPGSTILHTPVMPDPETFISKLRRLRMHSAWCRKHSELCSETPDLHSVIDGEQEGSEAAPAEEDFDDESAGLSANAAKPMLKAPAGPKFARTQQLWNEPDDSTQSFTPSDIKRMPWLATYKVLRKQNLQEDPLWCGASHCHDPGYVAHAHQWAQVLPHAIAVNEPRQGRRGGVVQTDPHEKEHFSYARAPRPAGLQPAAA